MRFAVDACVPAQLAEALTALGADVVSGAGRPAMPDEEVLRGAVARDRVLITTDKDFGELVFRRGQAAVGVVLIRMDITSQEVATHIAQRIAALADDGRGVFAVLEEDGARVRAMPGAGAE
jgi:predicted nuclease of predicted toxin-antitoxin system